MANAIACRLAGDEVIVEPLVAEGVTHRFGNLGHGDTALIDAFAHNKDEITILPALHEQNASHMADGSCRQVARRRRSSRQLAMRQAGNMAEPIIAKVLGD